MQKIKTKLIFILGILLFANFAMGASTDDNTFKIGDRTSVNDKQLKMGDGQLRWNGTTSKMEISNDGAGFSAITDISANEAALLENTTVDTSVGSSALTIDLKIADGTTDPSAGSPVKTAFRDVTVTDGAYNLITTTGALTLVIPSGATLGHLDGTNAFIYIYLLDNVGAAELAVSTTVQDESSVQTTVALTTGSDLTTVLYSTTLRSNVPIRLIARVKSNQVTAGTWDLDVIENTPGSRPFAADSFNKRIKILNDNVRAEFARVTSSDCTSSPCSISDSSAGVSTITRVSTGLYNINFSPIFGGAAAVTCLVVDQSGSAEHCSIDTVEITPATVRVVCRNTTTGAVADARPAFICLGKD